MKYIQVDNYQENIDLQVLCPNSEMKLHFEFTPRYTPQYNGVVERKFQTLYARLRVTFTRDEIPYSMKKTLWDEGSRLVNVLDNEITRENESISPHVKMF